MPIANCIIKPECQSANGDLIELWAKESGQSSEYMTVNITTSNQQFGNQYSVMATLYLPSLWSKSSISTLQLGLAKAIASHFKLPLSEVQVITHVVNSGLVVEAGQEEHW